MATLAEVLAHMTGHASGRPQRINWHNFTPVHHARLPRADAFTDADFRWTSDFPSQPDRAGIHRLTNVRVTVAMNQPRSWYVIGRQSPLLLRHEQGHYDITFVVARELCRKLLELEWHHAVLEAVGESSPTRIVAQLRSDADRMARAAKADAKRMNDLYDDAMRGAKNADGTINPDAQARWDGMIHHAVSQDTGLDLLVTLAGGTPRTW